MLAQQLQAPSRAEPECPETPPGAAWTGTSKLPIANFRPATEEDRERFRRRMLRSISGTFVLPDGSGLIPWCGMRELALLSIIVLDHRVDRIQGRPERVTVSVDGKRVSRMPVARVTMGATRVVVDVEARVSDLNWAVEKAYKDRGEFYRLFRTAELEAQPRLRNARLVLGARRHRPAPDLEMALLKRLSFAGPHTVRSLQQSLPGHQHVREAVYSFCLRRRLAVDLWADDPLDMTFRLASAERWLP